MTVQAERLNFLRFVSHFRAVHRGASFAGLRTTSVRKLLPEYVFFLFVWQCTWVFISFLLTSSFPISLCRSWGFLCPVHTPDGEPCGLLNHMACNCRKSFPFDLVVYPCWLFTTIPSVANAVMPNGNPLQSIHVMPGVPKMFVDSKVFYFMPVVTCNAKTKGESTLTNTGKTFRCIIFP